VGQRRVDIEALLQYAPEIIAEADGDELTRLLEQLLGLRKAVTAAATRGGEWGSCGGWGGVGVGWG
jgi:hypothetical protein